ncbi:MAG: T9SS type A sorting domain-containing protein [Calditrichaeota bacterium]|nr:T9SS type A sorting domain-containing protein [Calditrichota bacterium]
MQFRFIFYFIMILLANSQIHRTANLYSLVDSIKQAMPYKETGLYVVPNQVERDSFAIVIDHILAGDFASAANSASNIFYELIEWSDTGNGNQIYYVLKEDSSQFKTKKNWKAWGTYFFKANATTTAAVEVPHAYFDTHTWRIGFEAYRANNSQFFLMTGAHRYTNSDSLSDVAHNTLNMFHLVHQKIAPHSTKTVQIHAFSHTHYAAQLPDVIVSNGTKFGSTDVTLMEQYIDDSGFNADIFDNLNVPNLGATHNVQGEWCRAQNPEFSFVHIEIDSFIRFDATNRSLITTGIIGGLDPIEDGTLPVQLIGSLQVKEIDGGFRIDAETATEDGLAEIQIQRKTLDENGSGAWIVLKRIESDPQYTSSGRKLPSSFDYIPTQSLLAITYRLITIDYAGQIDESVSNAEKIIYFGNQPEQDDAQLLQNSPNPFHESTAIRFIIEKQARYSLIIYDILGRQVRKLINSEQLNPTYYQRTWDGLNNSNQRVASGLYFFTLINHQSGQQYVKKLYFSR